MKFLSLLLPAYGGFTDHRFGFSETAGVHVIYGHNEAGKSTTLRAIDNLLYGFKPKVQDNYLHSNKNLLIGAVISDRNGNRLEFYRRKGSKNTLLGPGRETLPDDSLEQFLNGISREMFLRLYGLDHRTLVEGGEFLLSAKGEAGSSLFAAGVGPKVRDLLQELQKECDEIWRRQAKKPRLNRAVSTWKNTAKQLKESTLQADEWDKLQRNLAITRNRLAELQQKLTRLRQTLTRNERLQQILPVLGTYRNLTKELKQYAELPDLPENFTETRKEVAFKLEQVGIQLKDLESQHRQCQEALTAITPNYPLLERSKAIENLYKRLESYQSYHTELEVTRGKLSQIELQIDHLLQDLSLNKDLETARTVIPTSQRRERLRTLSRRYSELTQSISHYQELRGELKLKIDSLQNRLASLGQVRELDIITNLLHELRRHANLDNEIERLGKEFHRIQTQLDQAYNSLPWWQGSREELLILKQPPAQTLSNFESTFTSLEDKIDTCQTKLNDLKQDLQNQLEQKELLLAEALNLPSPQDLQRTRSKRDEVWDQLKHSWSQALPIREVEDLVRRYESLLERCDQISDQLFFEAEKVTQVNLIEHRIEELKKEITSSEQEKQELHEARAQLERQWRDCWTDLTFTPRSPQEMTEWLKQVETIKQLHLQLSELNRSLQSYQDKRRYYLAALEKELASLGLQETTKDLSLEQAINRAEIILKPLREKITFRDNTRRDLENARQDYQHTGHKLEQKKAELQEWQRSWEAEIKELQGELTPDATDTLLDQMEHLKNLLDNRDRLVQHQKALTHRISSYDHECRELLHLTLSPSHRDEIQNRPTSDQVESLYRLLGQSQRQQERREQYAQRITELQAEIERCHQRKTQLILEQKQLLHLTGRSSLDELPELEQQVARKRQLSNSLLQAKNTLLQLGAGKTLEEIFREASDCNPDLLKTEALNLKEQIAELEQQKDRLQQELGTLQERQRLMDGSAKAAEAAEQLAVTAAEIADLAHRYSRLKLAHYILLQAIEQYRLRNQGPLLAIASKYFSQLTCGNYKRLETDYGDDDNLHLTALNSNGSKVMVEYLSDGTRDQLFLALRLAIIEHSSSQREPLPFIADDILVHFDDERARSALETLLEFSQYTQVLLFTHLARDKDLASRLNPNRIQIHTLGVR